MISYEDFLLGLSVQNICLVPINLKRKKSMNDRYLQGIPPAKKIKFNNDTNNESIQMDISPEQKLYMDDKKDPLPMDICECKENVKMN